MSKGDLDGILVFGRKIKPAALGFVFLMLVYVMNGITDRGALDGSMWGDIVAAVGAAAATLLLLGWWGKSQRMAEYGLLFAFFTFGARTLYLLLTDPTAEKTLSGVGVCIIAVGAFLLERNDGARRHRGSGADAG